ncbi:unnamed protein product [Lasius platythorax]|uniref:DUF4219 domain-containing protein n=1 Tax=Lasius platythorax TaxID=488582 RepID=A0AAV2NFS1_9HYME
MERENERITKLKGEQDWNMWKFQMKILLASGEAWDVVLGHTLTGAAQRRNSGRTNGVSKETESMAENGQHSTKTHHIKCK